MTRSQKPDAVGARVPDALRPVGTSAVNLPEARLVSDEPIEVHLPAPEAVSKQELVERFNQLAREQAQVREREVGEALEMGDDVQLDIIGYVDGKLLPFSIRFDWWMELAPQEALPGFAEALAGLDVGDIIKRELTLPLDYPVESLRGASAQFLVDVRAARELLLPEDLTAPSFLVRLHRGGTLGEVMEALVHELSEVKQRQRRQQAQQQVLDVLASRLEEVELSDSLLDEEIRRRWMKAEGEALQAKDFTQEDAEVAFEAWRTDAATRADAERRLRIALALGAVIKRDRLTLEPNEVFEILDRNLASLGLKESEVSEALASPELYPSMLNLAWHLKAVEHVMGQARVHIGNETA